MSSRKVLIFLVILLAGISLNVGEAYGWKVKALEEALKGGKIIRRSAKGAKGAGKTFGGNSTKLAIILGIKNNSLWAAHHIIPVELKYHRALKKIGFHFDIAENGIKLPTKRGLHPKLPLHRGSHPVYTAAVRKELDKIPKNASPEKTKNMVDEVMTRFRKEIESGKQIHKNLGAPDPWIQAKK